MDVHPGLILPAFLEISYLSLQAVGRRLWSDIYQGLQRKLKFQHFCAQMRSLEFYMDLLHTVFISEASLLDLTWLWFLDRTTPWTIFSFNPLPTYFCWPSARAFGVAFDKATILFWFSFNYTTYNKCTTVALTFLLRRLIKCDYALSKKEMPT